MRDFMCSLAASPLPFRIWFSFAEPTKTDCLSGKFVVGNLAKVVSLVATLTIFGCDYVTSVTSPVIYLCECNYNYQANGISGQPFST